MEDIIYTDYANWLIEVDDLLKLLKKEESFLYYRYKHILNVLNHLYYIKVETNDLTPDQEAIFSVGFSFLFEQYEQIWTLLKHTYDNNLKAMNKQQKTIELLLSVHEFQIDVEAVIDVKETGVFLEIEDEINTYINNKQEAPETLFEKLDVASSRVYEENEIDYYPISEIFFDIAIEYNLVD